MSKRIVHVSGPFSSVAQLCLTLCDPMNHSMPALPIHHQPPMSIESVMPSSHLILCRPLLLLPSIPPSIRVFSNESTLRMRWPKYWSFRYKIQSQIWCHVILCSICQQIWKTQQWPQDWKRPVFIPIPKKGNAKECSNYRTIALISHASKVMLKILQARLQ